MQLLINLNKTWFGVHPIAEMTTVLSSHSVKAHTNTAFLTSIHKSSNQKLTYGSHHTQFKSIRMELPFQKKMASYIFTRTLSTRSFTKKKTTQNLEQFMQTIIQEPYFLTKQAYTLGLKLGVNMVFFSLLGAA